MTLTVEPTADQQNRSPRLDALAQRATPPTRSAVWAVAVWVAGALFVVAVALLTARVQFNPLSPLVTAGCLGLVVGAGAGATVLAWRWRGSPRWSGLWPHLVTAVTAVTLSSVLVISLAATPLGVQATSADQSFRSVIMERYSLSALPTDFGYDGHGSFYPPLWFWLAGRAGALLGLPGWEMMKWAQIATAFCVPLLALLFWRRVVGLQLAALVAIVSTLAVPDVIKGDEWLSLAIMLPWWIDAFADVRGPDVRRRPAWVHGLVAGAMLSLYTAFFLPAALATLIVAVRAIRAGSWAPVLRRWAVIVAVGLVVWAWVWVPAVIERLTGPPYDSAQLRWFGNANAVPAPVTLSVVGVLALLGIAALAWCAPRLPVLRRVAIFAAAVLVVLVVGLVVTAAGHPILVQKTYLIIQHTLVVAAVIGSAQAVRVIARSPSRRDSVTRTAVALVAAVAVTLALGYLDDTVRTERLALAYNTRLPDGSVSRYAPDPAGSRASADDVAAVIDRAAPVGTPVVLSSRYDLFVYSGYWNFQQFTDSYAHPHSRYTERDALITRMGQTTDPRQMHTLLTENSIERVDALVLIRDRGSLVRWDHRVNRFPYGTVVADVTFDQGAFTDPDLFETTWVGNWLVVLPR